MIRFEDMIGRVSNFQSGSTISPGAEAGTFRGVIWSKQDDAEEIYFQIAAPTGMGYRETLERLIKYFQAGLDRWNEQGFEPKEKQQ